MWAGLPAPLPSPDPALPTLPLPPLSLEFSGVMYDDGSDEDQMADQECEISEKVRM